jgi:hypothetical protein
MAGVPERSVAHLGPWAVFLIRKDRDLYVPNFFRDSITHANVFGV